LEGFIEGIRILLDELTASGENALNSDQMHRLIVADLSFHSLLIKLAANVRILKLVNETRLMIRIYGIQRRHGIERDELEAGYRTHQEILQAVLDRDPDRAQELLANHIQTSVRKRLDEFDHLEREASLSAVDINKQLFLDRIAP
jgi:DNA-binding GntR family transcriptional regulator